MEISSIISFVRIATTYPKLMDDRKDMQKTVNKLGDEAFKTRKKKAHDDIALQKREIMECYDKYKEIVKDGITDVILNEGEDQLDHLVLKMMKAFGLISEESEKEEEEKDG